MGHEPRNNSNDERVGPLPPAPAPTTPPPGHVFLYILICVSVTARCSSKHFIHWNQFYVALNPIFDSFIKNKNRSVHVLCFK